MNITEVDQNFKQDAQLPEQDIVWYDAKQEAFKIYGIAKTEEDYLRMPREVAASVSDGVAFLCDNTAGVRLRFCTDSPYIAIKAVFPQLCCFAHMPLTGTAGFDLYRETQGKQTFVGTYIPIPNQNEGFSGILYPEREEETMQNYLLNFPLYNPVTKLYIGLKRGSGIAEPNGYQNRKPVVFYGSSITQGGCASRPGNCYQNFLSRSLNMDYLCLGFSGNAKGEQEMADYMAGLDMCAFVSDYDHNAPDAEYLQRTHYALYETIRKRNPSLPYIMLSHPNRSINDAVLRRKVIMESYIKALDSGDRQVYFVDGDALFAGEEYDSCTVDGCHPNDLGFYRMAQGLLAPLRDILYR